MACDCAWRSILRSRVSPRRECASVIHRTWIAARPGHGGRKKQGRRKPVSRRDTATGPHVAGLVARRLSRDSCGGGSWWEWLGGAGKVACSVGVSRQQAIPPGRRQLRARPHLSLRRISDCILRVAFRHLATNCDFGRIVELSTIEEIRKRPRVAGRHNNEDCSLPANFTETMERIATDRASFVA